MTASSSVAPFPEFFRHQDDNGVVTLTLNTPRRVRGDRE
jgi:hypothetical protein